MTCPVCGMPITPRQATARLSFAQMVEMQTTDMVVHYICKERLVR